MALSITTFGTKVSLYQLTQKTSEGFSFFSPDEVEPRTSKGARQALGQMNETNYNIYQVLSQAIPQPSALANANEERPTNNHNFNNREQKWAQGRKASHKTTPPSNIGIPELGDKIVNASSKGAIRPTPHTEWPVKGKRRPEHKSKICMSIFQQNCMKAYDPITYNKTCRPTL